MKMQSSGELLSASKLVVPPCCTSRGKGGHRTKQGASSPFMGALTLAQKQNPQSPPKHPDSNTSVMGIKVQYESLRDTNVQTIATETSKVSQANTSTPSLRQRVVTTLYLPSSLPQTQYSDQTDAQAYLCTHTHIPLTTGSGKEQQVKEAGACHSDLRCCKLFLSREFKKYPR